jgi:hypothetical protein
MFKKIKYTSEPSQTIVSLGLKPLNINLVLVLNEILQNNSIDIPIKFYFDNEEKIPKVCFVHQIQNCFQDYSDLLQELYYARCIGYLRQFSTELGIILMQTECYYNLIHKCVLNPKTAQIFISEVLMKCSDLFILREQLFEVLGKAGFDEILFNGFLEYRNLPEFHSKSPLMLAFSFPQFGAFSKQIEIGRKSLVKAVKVKKSKSHVKPCILHSKLYDGNFVNKTVFTIDYILKDSLGIGMLKQEVLQNDTLLYLADF